MAEKKRFDTWPGVVPKVGLVIQVHLGEHIVETPVLARTTADHKTFRVVIADPYNQGTNVLLEITPSASGKGRVDGFTGKKPYWRIVPQTTGAEYIPVTLFYPD